MGMKKQIIGGITIILIVLGLNGCIEENDVPGSSSELKSHFGVHLGNLNYDSAIDYIRELGEHLYVRNEFYEDVFGWKYIKGEYQQQRCEECCASKPPADCDCEVGDIYYCEPNSRDSLLETPIVADFYNNNFNQFVNFYTSRYDNVPPTRPQNLTADYPHGNEDIYREYVSFLVQNFSDKIKYWEVGNENDAAGFWAGTPEEYADMLVIASEEIKENCADCKVGVSFAHPNVSHKDPELRERWFAADVCYFPDPSRYTPIRSGRYH